MNLLRTLSFLVLGLPLFAQTAPTFFDALTRSNQSLEPLQMPFLGSEAEALELQNGWVQQQQTSFGPVIGYKAALTSVQVQAKFGVKEPVLGVLLTKMIFDAPVNIPLQFGSMPVYEGDLLVRVSSEAINEAKGPAAVLAHLDELYPFIELPDLVYAKGVKLSGPALIAINAGARYGIKGAAIKLDTSPETQKALKEFKLELRDGSGKVVGSGSGAALLGDPLLAVIWIRDQLHKQGKQLKKGDLLSLGSLTPLVPATVTGKVVARYTGLPHTPEALLEFTFQPNVADQ